MKEKILTFIFILFLIPIGFSQKKNTKIPLILKEISGLERFQDSLFIAINDSGNKPVVYILNQKGKILHSVYLKNATNIDWEDITLDENNNLYIADVGNNFLKRTSFEIYYFNLKAVFEKDSISVDKMVFNYPKTNQKEQTFDCESVAFYDGKLYLLNKNTPAHFREANLLFELEVNKRAQEAKLIHSFNLKRNRNYFLDAITSMDIYRDTCYFLSYSNIYSFVLKSENKTITKVKSFALLSQKEALCVQDTYFYIANERSTFLRKQKIKKLNFKINN